MIQATIFSAVWGSEYINRFQTLTLRTLLAPRNLPKFNESIKTEYLILTTEEGRSALSKSPIFSDLKRLVDVSFLDLPSEGSTNVDRKNVAWKLATEHARRRGGYAVQMPPDVIWSDGAFEYFARLIVEGKKAIFVNWHLRALEELFIPEFESRFGGGFNPVSIAPRELVLLTLKHSHPLNSVHLRSADCFTYWPEMVFWPVPGQGVLMHTLALTPLIFDASVCALNEMRLLTGHWSADQLSFVIDSDDAFMASLAPVGKDRHFYSRHEKVDVAFVGSWWLDVHTPAADQLALSHYRLKFDETNMGAWRTKMLEAEAFIRKAFHAREAYRIWREAKQLGLKYASAVLAYAISVNLAGTVTRSNTGITILLPRDEAFADIWSTDMKAILGAGKREIVEFLRAHVLDEKIMDKASVQRAIGKVKIVSGPHFVGGNTIYVIADLLSRLPAASRGSE